MDPSRNRPTPLVREKVSGAGNRLSVNLDPADVRISAGAMTAAGSQIDESDFIDFAQVHFVKQVTFSLACFHIDAHPLDIARVKLDLMEIVGVCIGEAAGEPRAIGQLQDGTNLVETRRLCSPPNSRLSGKIDIRRLMA